LGRIEHEKPDANPSEQGLLRVDSHDSFDPASRQLLMHKATIERLERIISLVNTRREASLAPENSINPVAEGEMLGHHKPSSALDSREARVWRAATAGTRLALLTGERWTEKQLNRI